MENDKEVGNKVARDLYKMRMATLSSEGKCQRVERTKARDMWRNHRMLKEKYDTILKAQGGVCAICHKPPLGKPLGIDHNHRCCGSSKSCELCNRGLLCYGCNFMLGLMRDNVELLRNAVAYLEKQ